MIVHIGIFSHLKKKLTYVNTVMHTSEKILVLPPIELVFKSNHVQIYDLKKYIGLSRDLSFNFALYFSKI